MLAEGSGAGTEPSCPVCEAPSSEAPTVADVPVVDDREPGTQPATPAVPNTPAAAARIARRVSSRWTPR